MLRRVLKVLGGIVAALVIVFVVVSLASVVMRGQARQIPAPTGPNHVGRVELALTDTSRTDPFLANGRSREISVWIWYPTDAAADEAAPYFPSAWADAIGKASGLVSLYDQDRKAVTANSAPNAPLLGDPPVVVLLPGLGRAVPDYTALAEEIASHGYAVVAINMTGSSIVGFPDGHVVDASAKGNVDGSLASDIDAWYVDASRIIDVWVDDVAFVTTTLAAEPPSIGPLDFSHLAYVGHSLGGATSFQRCSADEGCVGAVDLDGTLFSEVGETGMAAPGLVIRAESGAMGDFATRADAGFARVQEAGQVRIVRMAGTAHDNFTDDDLLYGPLWGPLGILGSIDGNRETAITRDLTTAFLDQVLKGASPDSLDATISGYPELTEQ